MCPRNQVPDNQILSKSTSKYGLLLESNRRNCLPPHPPICSWLSECWRDAFTERALPSVCSLPPSLTLFTQNPLVSLSPSNSPCCAWPATRCWMVVPVGRSTWHPRHLPMTARPCPTAVSLLLACSIAVVLPPSLECCCPLLSGWLPAGCVKKSLAAGVKKNPRFGLKRTWLLVCRTWSTAACELIIVRIRSYDWSDSSFLQSSDCELKYSWFILICLIKI
jgi:hypothetical protein